MEVTTSYYNRCRLCIAEARLSLQLFETEAIRLDLVNKIRSYLSINVSLHDGLPQQICYECLSRIELFHSYKQSCLESQHTLKHWNLFCDGGTVPQMNKDGDRVASPKLLPLSRIQPGTYESCGWVYQHQSFSSDVDIFSGRSRSPDAQNKNNASILAKRMRAENIGHHFKSSKVTPPRKPSHLSSPVINNSSTATPPKRKNINSTYIEQLSPQNRKQIPPERVSSGDSPPSRRTLSPSSCLEVMLKETDAVSSLQSCVAAKSKHDTSARKQVQDSNVKKLPSQSRTPSPRAQTPLKEIKSSPPEKTHNQLTSSKSKMLETRSQSLDRSRSSEKSSSLLPTIQIISIESLATVPEKSKTKSSPENVGSPADKSTESAKPFASTISEMVKQRKRSNSVSLQSYTSVKKPRKPRTRPSSALSSGSVGTNKENSDANLSDWLSDKEDDNEVLPTNSQNESDAVSVQSLDDSTQALLRLLESDDDDDDFCQSDGENYESDVSRAGTPSPRNPMNAYVKVEKLPSDSDPKLRVRTEEELNAGVPVSRMGRPRQQSNQYRLVKVVKDEVTGRERYKCIKCGSLLSNRCYIKEHMKIHTGDKDYKCQKCGKAFRNNYMLKAHAAVHLRERKYSCSICGSTFVQRDRLMQHFRVHGAEQLECTICGHKTNQKSAMRRHMRIHTGERPYECEFCGGKYTDRSTWVNHRRIHTGERPFRCVTCNRTFNRKTCLRVHWRTHSDYRPYCCQLCLRRFKAKEVLVKHLSCVHRSIMRSVVNFISNDDAKE